MPRRPLTHAELQPRRYSPAERRYQSDPFYRTARWLKIRRMILARHPLCRDPYGVHVLPTPATDVDHIVSIARGGARLDMANLQALCKSCHSRKTQEERNGRPDSDGKPSPTGY